MGTTVSPILHHSTPQMHRADKCHHPVRDWSKTAGRTVPRVRLGATVASLGLWRGKEGGARSLGAWHFLGPSRGLGDESRTTGHCTVEADSAQQQHSRARGSSSVRRGPGGNRMTLSAWWVRLAARRWGHSPPSGECSPQVLHERPQAWAGRAEVSAGTKGQNLKPWIPPADPAHLSLQPGLGKLQHFGTLLSTSCSLPPASATFHPGIYPQGSLGTKQH